MPGDPWRGFSGPRVAVELVNGVRLLGRLTRRPGDVIEVEVDEGDVIEVPVQAVLATYPAEAG